MMKGLLLASVTAVLLSVTMGADNTFEDFDVDKAFGDEPKVKTAVACLLDQEPCGELQPLRDAIPSLIETDCSVCTPKQKEKYDQVKKVLSEQYPDMHKALLDKYSPKSE